MMYNAVNVNSFSFNPSDGKLYRGTYFSEEEMENIRNYIKNKIEVEVFFFFFKSFSCKKI